MTTPTARRAPVLRFLDEPAPCRVCSITTVFAKLGGRIPMHPMCDIRAWLAEPDADALADATALLSRVLGPLSTSTAPPVLPEEVGPCQSCHRPMRRYGPWAASSHCSRCRKEPPR